MTDLWQYLKNAEKPIVLYGTGDGADKILNVMAEKGIKASETELEINNIGNKLNEIVYDNIALITTPNISLSG